MHAPVDKPGSAEIFPQKETPKNNGVIGNIMDVVVKKPLKFVLSPLARAAGFSKKTYETSLAYNHAAVNALTPGFDWERFKGAHKEFEKAKQQTNTFFENLLFNELEKNSKTLDSFWGSEGIVSQSVETFFASLPPIDAPACFNESQELITKDSFQKHLEILLKSNFKVGKEEFALKKLQKSKEFRSLVAQVIGATSNVFTSKEELDAYFEKVRHDSRIPVNVMKIRENGGVRLDGDTKTVSTHPTVLEFTKLGVFMIIWGGAATLDVVPWRLAAPDVLPDFANTNDFVEPAVGERGKEVFTIAKEKILHELNWQIALLSISMPTANLAVKYLFTSNILIAMQNEPGLLRALLKGILIPNLKREHLVKEKIAITLVHVIKSLSLGLGVLGGLTATTIAASGFLASAIALITDGERIRDKQVLETEFGVPLAEVKQEAKHAQEILEQAEQEAKVTPGADQGIWSYSVDVVGTFLDVMTVEGTYMSSDMDYQQQFSEAIADTDRIGGRFDIPDRVAENIKKEITSLKRRSFQSILNSWEFEVKGDSGTKDPGYGFTAQRKLRTFRAEYGDEAKPGESGIDGIKRFYAEVFSDVEAEDFISLLTTPTKQGGYQTKTLPNPSNDVPKVEKNFDSISEKFLESIQKDLAKFRKYSQDNIDRYFSGQYGDTQQADTNKEIREMQEWFEDILPKKVKVYEQEINEYLAQIEKAIQGLDRENAEERKKIKGDESAGEDYKKFTVDVEVDVEKQTLPKSIQPFHFNVDGLLTELQKHLKKNKETGEISDMLHNAEEAGWNSIMVDLGDIAVILGVVIIFGFFQGHFKKVRARNEAVHGNKQYKNFVRNSKIFITDLINNIGSKSIKDIEKDFEDFIKSQEEKAEKIGVMNHVREYITSKVSSEYVQRRFAPETQGRDKTVRLLEKVTEGKQILSEKSQDQVVGMLQNLLEIIDENKELSLDEELRQKQDQMLDAFQALQDKAIDRVSKFQALKNQWDNIRSDYKVSVNNSQFEVRKGETDEILEGVESSIQSRIEAMRGKMKLTMLEQRLPVTRLVRDKDGNNRVLKSFLFQLNPVRTPSSFLEKQAEQNIDQNDVLLVSPLQSGKFYYFQKNENGVLQVSVHSKDQVQEFPDDFQKGQLLGFQSDNLDGVLYTQLHVNPAKVTGLMVQDGAIGVLEESRGEIEMKQYQIII